MILWFALLFGQHASAQGWGQGIYPSTSCSSPYRPAGAAINGSDEISNLRGQLANRNARIDALQAKLKRFDNYLSIDKENMGLVLTTGAIRAIDEHRRYKNSFGSYQSTCGDRVSSSAATVEVELPGLVRQSAVVDQNLRPPPLEYCYKDSHGSMHNTWASFVEDGGTVSRTVCDYFIPGVAKSREPYKRARCHDGLQSYYDHMAAKETIDKEIAALDTEASSLASRLNKIKEEITEGTYCPTCNAQKRGYSNQDTASAVNQNAGILNVLAMAYRLKAMGNGASPYGGGGYPVRPYAAPVPGYYGVGPGGQYGSVPGGIGAGSFGCQGANPLSVGNPQTPTNVQSIFGGPSPFSNPYSSPQLASLFNPGAGPWGFPTYGNGTSAFQDPFAPTNPFLQTTNPFLGQGGVPNPFTPNPYGALTNPFAPNPYGAQNPYGVGGYNPYNPYGPYNPYASSPYGISPYGPGYPYQNASPYFAGGPYGGGSGYPYAPYGPGYGGAGGTPYGVSQGLANYSPYNFSLGSPVGNFYSQVNQINANIQGIQSGLYYGRGAPLYTPYNGPISSPIFNTPGSTFNTTPTTPAPAIVPYR